MEDKRHLRFAYELVAEAGGLSQRVLRELVGRPRRYAELQPLQGGRRENELTDTLRRLERDGLIDRRTSQREVAVVHTYELTLMGTRAEVEMQKLRPVHEIPRVFPKRQRSELGIARRRGPGWVLPGK